MTTQVSDQSNSTLMHWFQIVMTNEPKPNVDITDRSVGSNLTQREISSAYKPFSYTGLIIWSVLVLLDWTNGEVQWFW